MCPLPLELPGDQKCSRSAQNLSGTKKVEYWGGGTVPRVPLPEGRGGLAPPSGPLFRTTPLALWTLEIVFQLQSDLLVIQDDVCKSNKDSNLAASLLRLRMGVMSTVGSWERTQGCTSLTPTNKCYLWEQSAKLFSNFRFDLLKNQAWKT